MAEVDPSQLDRLELSLQSVVQENARLAEEVQLLREQTQFQLTPPMPPSEWNEPWGAVEGQTVEADSLQRPQDGYMATYDNGITIRPRTLEKSP